MTDKINYIQREQDTARELGRFDVRITMVENVVEQQNKILSSIEKKITWGSAVAATLLFLMTPIGIAVWDKVIKVIS